jgi:DNA-binding response OmpR family regulator
MTSPIHPPHRILVAEDDDDIRQLNTEVLIDSGYHVDAVPDGAVAWAAIQHQHYDLLLTDYAMPHLTGVGLLRKVRSAGMVLPAIMATGSLPAAELNRHAWLKPVVVVVKPYTIPELLRTVRAVLRANIRPGRPSAPRSSGLAA